LNTLLCAALLTGCASVGVPFQQLSQAGDLTTTALRSDAEAFVEQLDHGDASAAFAATWKQCHEQPSSCQPVALDPAAQAQRAELARVVRARVSAIEALQRSYEDAGRLITDAQRPPAQQAPRAEAATTMATYASLVGLGAVKELQSRLQRPLVYALEWRAARLRQAELKAANAELGELVGTLKDILQQELRLHDVLARSIIQDKVSLSQALLQSGLVSSSDIIRATLSPDVTLSRDADALAAKSPAVRVAVGAALAASEQASVRMEQLRYRAALQVLEELERLHAEFGRSEQVAPLVLQSRVGELKRLGRRVDGPRRALVPVAPTPPR
jgi:hypothetical protein